MWARYLDDGSGAILVPMAARTGDVLGDGAVVAEPGTDLHEQHRAEADQYERTITGTLDDEGSSKDG